MANSFKIVARKRRNKDGSTGVKNEYAVFLRRRGSGTREVGLASSMKGAEHIIDQMREDFSLEHIRKHPDDTHFIQKHFGKKAN